MAKKKNGKKKVVAQFSDSQLEAVVDNLNGDLGWNENDHVTVDELEGLESSDFEEDEIENMDMVTLAYLDANCDGFSSDFDYKLKPLAVEEEEEEEEEEDEKPAPKKKGGKKKAPAKKGKKKEEPLDVEEEEEPEEEKPTKKKGGKKKEGKKKEGKKKGADKKKAPAKKKGAESIVKGSKTKKHWDSRFGVYPIIEAADEGLTFDEICEAVQDYCTEEFSVEHSIESVEASVMFVLPMFVVAELVAEDLTGDEATYLLSE